MGLPNVLIGVVTFERDALYRREFFQYLQQLQAQSPNPAIVIVTNSGERDKLDMTHQAKLAGVTVEIIVNKSPAQGRLDVITQNRNMVRDYFLEKDFSHLFCLDSDLIGPVNVLDVLCKHEKPVVSGWYLNAVQLPGQSKLQIRPVVYVAHSEGRVRQLNLADVLPSRLIPLALTGLGCTLATRTVVEKTPFRRISDKGGEDVAFYKDVFDKLDIRAYCDTRARFIHKKFAAGDKRNRLFDPRNYRMKDGESSQ